MPSGHRPPPPVGTARVAISGTSEGGQSWTNVFWLNLTATTHVLADLKAVIDNFEGAYVTKLMAHVNNGWTLTQAKATWLYSSGNEIAYLGSYTAGGGVSGSASNEASCAVIDWSITDFYRGGHPRTYLPGLSDSVIGSGRTLGGTFRTTLATDANGFITSVNALSSGGITAVALGTVRFASGNAWLSPPVFRPYGGAAVRSILGLQRRRLGA